MEKNIELLLFLGTTRAFCHIHQFCNECPFYDNNGNCIISKIRAIIDKQIKERNNNNE